MPTDPKGCLLRIRGVYGSFKSAELRLADYILNNAGEVVNMTMEELEAESRSSYATIYRFCKKLGFSGFKELKQSLVADILQDSTPRETPDDLLIRAGMDARAIAERVFAFSRQVLDDCRSMFNLEAIQEAVDLLVNGHQVLCVGGGTSGVSARYAFTKFFRLGIDCQVELDPVLSKMKTGMLSSDDVLFAISSSGRTRFVIEIAELAQERGAKVVALTDYAISPLTKMADVNLYTTPRNVNHHLQLEMPLLIGQITIIDVLQMCCIPKLPSAAVDGYRRTKQVADTEKR